MAVTSNYKATLVAERDNLWNLHNGGRKWLIHLKIEDIRECWRILEMYYCGFEKRKIQY